MRGVTTLLPKFRRSFLSTIPVLFMAGFVVLPTAAQDEVLMAERLPLATRSMLLDVTQTPEGRFIAVGERGHIILSGDGSEWDQADAVPSRSTLTTVTAAGNLLWAAGHDTTIVFSEDGGQNWDLQYFDPERQQPIMDIHFVDEQNGFAIGAYGLMLRTADGGVTWEDFEVSEESWHLNGMIDLGAGTLLITGEAGLSYLSLDGGDSWEVIDMPYPGSMFGVVDAGPCIVVFGLRGNVQQACDESMNWEEMVWESVETPIDYSLAGAAYQDGAVLMAGNSGQILIRREDGGLEAILHPSGVDFAAVAPLGSGEWLLVGDEGPYVFSGLRGQ